MVKIPEQYYVGIRSQHGSDTPLGFATPFDHKDKKMDEKIATITGWTNSWPAKDLPKHDPVTFTNTPIAGFSVENMVKRTGWNGGNVVWRVYDPRGMEFEISSNNFCKIIESCTITNGVIDQQCVWGRDGARNVLLPVNSEPYLEATKTTQVLATTVSIKDVDIGDTILFKNQMEAVYLGRHKTISKFHNQHVDYGKKEAFHIFSNIVYPKTTNLSVWEKERQEKDYNKLLYSQSPSISKIIEKYDWFDPISPDTARRIINDKITDKCGSVVSSNYHIIKVVDAYPKKISLVATELSKSDVTVFADTSRTIVCHCTNEKIPVWYTLESINSSYSELVRYVYGRYQISFDKATYTDSRIRSYSAHAHSAIDSIAFVVKNDPSYLIQDSYTFHHTGNYEDYTFYKLQLQVDNELLDIK